MDKAVISKTRQLTAKQMLCKHAAIDAQYVRKILTVVNLLIRPPDVVGVGRPQFLPWLFDFSISSFLIRQLPSDLTG